MPAELQAHDEQPQGKREAHGADRDARSEASTDERAEDAADNQIDEKSGIETGALKMERAADEGEAEAKREVGADDAASIERREAEKGQGTERSSAG